jgi:hypothetical protein
MFAAGFLGAGAFRLMLSKASLLLALKSGCLNSHAYQVVSKALIRFFFLFFSSAFRLTPAPYGDEPLSSLLCLTL